LKYNFDLPSGKYFYHKFLDSEWVKSLHVQYIRDCVLS